jgi:hypothetical protein
MTLDPTAARGRRLGHSPAIEAGHALLDGGAIHTKRRQNTCTGLLVQGGDRQQQVLGVYPLGGLMQRRASSQGADRSQAAGRKYSLDQQSGGRRRVARNLLPHVGEIDAQC